MYEFRSEIGSPINITADTEDIVNVLQRVRRDGTLKRDSPRSSGTFRQR